MTYFIVSSFLNTIACAICCIFVILSGPRSKTTYTFSIFTFFVFLWSSFYFLWITSHGQTNALIFARLLNIAALFIPPSFFHFCCHLLNRYEEHSRIIKKIYIFNFLFIPVGFTQLYINNVFSTPLFLYWPSAGKLFFILILEYMTVIGYSLYIILEKLRTSHGTERQKLKIIFYGLILGFLGGSTNFPLLYKVPIIPFGNALVVIYVVAITYVILKYQFMDIKIILKRSVVYTILITLITLFFFLLTYFTEHEIKQIVGYQSFLISALSATVIAIVFIPLKNFIQNIVEKYLFRKNFSEIAEENELLRQEIIQTEKLKSIAILASGMAHEIKNPLTALKTFSEYLPQKIDDKEFLKKFAPIINREVNRIDTLVHELLDFAKPAPLQLKPTNIHILLDHILEFLNNDFIKHRIRITKNYHLEPGPILNLDANQFKQALLNILLNAVEAIPAGGELTISTTFSAKPGHLIIKIQDSGIGINPEDLSSIFDPFFTKKDCGTGLGLSITYEIVRNHNGRIFVESQPGSGTTFIIELPYNSPL